MGSAIEAEPTEAAEPRPVGSVGPALAAEHSRAEPESEPIGPLGAAIVARTEHPGVTEHARAKPEPFGTEEPERQRPLVTSISWSIRRRY